MADKPQYAIVARPKNYWMSARAVSITLNALNEANRIQASTAAGALIFVYFDEYKEIGDRETFGYDAGHNFKSWPLITYPTFFETNKAVYIHVAIPRTESVSSQAMFVYPTVILDVEGYEVEAVPMQDDEGNYIDEKGDIVDTAAEAATAYVRKKKTDGSEQDADPIGSEDYYYIYLHGRLTSSGSGYTFREWNPMYDTGRLNTDETWGEVITLEQLAKEMKKKVDVEWFQRIFTIHGTDGKRKILDYDEDGEPIYDYDEDGNYIYEGQKYDPQTGKLIRRDIKPNDMDHEITDTESMFGTWTEQFLSALGKGSGSGGGGGAELNEPLYSINEQEMGYPPVGGSGKITVVYNYATRQYEWGTAGGGEDLNEPLRTISRMMSLPTQDEQTFIWDQQTNQFGWGNYDGRYLKLTADSEQPQEIQSNIDMLGNFNMSIGNVTIGTGGPSLVSVYGDIKVYRNGQDPTEDSVLTLRDAKGLFVRTDFFSKLFQPYKKVNGQNVAVSVNDADVISGSVLIDNLKLMVGTWTDSYLSALGQGSGGSGGVELGNLLNTLNTTQGIQGLPQNGQTLVYNGGWTFGTAGINASEVNSLIGTYLTNHHYVNDEYSWWGQKFSSGSKVISGQIKDTLDILPQASQKPSIGASANTYGKLYVDEIYIGSAKISWDSTTGGLHLTKAMYSDEWLSALGAGSSGSGGVELNSLLLSLNNSGLGAHGSTNTTIVWNGSQWSFGTTGIDANAVNSLLSQKELTIKDGSSTLGTWSPSASGNIDISGVYTGKTWWGRTFASGSNAVKGDMTDVGNITFEASGKSIGGLMYFNTTNSHVDIGGTTSATDTKLYVNGNIRAGSANGAFIQIGALRIVYEQSTNALKIVNASDYSSANANFYAMGFVSALGSGSSSTGFDLNPLLNSLNGTSLNPAGQSNKVLVNNNGTWSWQEYGGGSEYVHPTDGANTTITAANGLVLSSITVNNLGHVTAVGSKTLAEADIPDLSWSKITSGTPTTLSGYGITDAVTAIVVGESGTPNVNKIGVTVNGNNTGFIVVPFASKADLLKTSRNIWGRPFNGSADVNGDITQATSITFSGITSGNNGGFIDFRYNGGTTGQNNYTSRIIEDTSGVLKINNTIWASLSGNVGIGTNSPLVKLDVSGDVKATRFYLKKASASDTGVYLVYENGGVHLVGAGFYSDSYISALGQGSSGGGTTDITLDLGFSGSLLTVNVSGVSKSVNLSSLVSGYASQSWVTQQGYAKTADVTKTLTIKQGDTTLGTYNGTEAKTITIEAGGGGDDTKDTTGTKALNGTKMYLVAAKEQDTYAVTNTNSNCFISADGDIYSKGSKVALASDYLPLSGGTLTGALTYKRTDLDVTKSNNGASTTQWPSTFSIVDKNGNILVRTEGVVNTDGSIDWYSYVRSYNTSGSQIAQRGIRYKLSKPDSNNAVTGTWTVDDAASFRTAIGVADSNFVRTTGDQDVGGSKHFTAETTIGTSGDTTNHLKVYGGLTCIRGGLSIGYKDPPTGETTDAAANQLTIAVRSTGDALMGVKLSGKGSLYPVMALNHDGTRAYMAVNRNAVTSYNFDVNGTSYLGSDVTVNGSVYLNNMSRGVYAKDTAANYFPLIYQNNANLWIGATHGKGYHHDGETYISAGWNTVAQTGNPTIYISVPTSNNTSGTSNTNAYAVLHSGNISDYLSGGYLPTTGGTINGTNNTNALTINANGSGDPLVLNATRGYTGIVFKSNGTGKWSMAENSSDQRFYWYSWSANNIVFSITEDGNVGIGLGGNNPSYKLHVSGTGYFTGDLYANGSKVLTSGNTVTTDTTQTITGAKTFNGSVGIGGINTNYNLYVYGTSFFRGDISSDFKPSSTDCDLGTTDKHWGYGYINNMVGNRISLINSSDSEIAISGSMHTGYINANNICNPASSITIQGNSSSNAKYNSTYGVNICTGGGNVGIGASAQSGYKLYVNGKTNINGDVDITKGKTIYFQHNASGVPEISIGTGSNDQNLYLKGVNLYFNGSIISSSDMRLKDVDELVDGDIESIARAPIFYYRWKKTPEFGPHLGSSAQYWQNVFSCAVIKDGEGYLGLDYAATALAAAVMTARKVLTHEEEIAALKRTVDEQARKIGELEQEVELLKAA